MTTMDRTHASSAHRGRLTDEVAHACISAAITAPSPHNAQPWWTRLEGDAIVVGFDPTRSLAVVDPQDRESFISVGCFAFLVRVALAHRGIGSTIQYFPEPKDPDACLAIRLTDGAGDPEFARLTQAIDGRRTSSGSFDNRNVDRAEMTALFAAADLEEINLVALSDVQRLELRYLVGEADRVQMSDRAYRRELTSWLHSKPNDQRDGLHGVTGETQTSITQTKMHPQLMRAVNYGGRRSDVDQTLIADSPVVAVVGTDGDAPADWLRCGLGLARILLEASQRDLRVAYLNQLVENSRTRRRVTKMAHAGIPQVVLRIGYGPLPSAQPRRALSDLLRT